MVFLNMYQHVKSYLDIVDLKILLSDWLKTLWPTSKDQEFFQIWDLCKNAANNIHSYYRRNPTKSKDQILSQFSHFMKQITFSRKSNSVTYHLIWVSSNMFKPEKKKHDKKTKGRAGIAYFTRPFRLPPRVQCYIKQFRHHWILQEQYWSITWTGKIPTWNFKWVHKSLY